MYQINEMELFGVSVCPGPRSMMYIMPCGKTFVRVKYAQILDLSQSEKKSMSEWADIFEEFNLSRGSEKYTIFQILDLNYLEMWDESSWLWAQWDVILMPHGIYVCYDRSQIIQYAGGCY